MTTANPNPEPSILELILLKTVQFKKTLDEWDYLPEAECRTIATLAKSQEKLNFNLSCLISKLNATENQYSEFRMDNPEMQDIYTGIDKAKSVRLANLELTIDFISENMRSHRSTSGLEIVDTYITLKTTLDDETNVLEHLDGRIKEEIFYLIDGDQK